MKKNAILFFLTILFCLFLILSVLSFFQQKRAEKFTVSLENFQSDFLEQQDKDPLIDGIISKQKRFIAFGEYVRIPPGEYKAIYFLESPSLKPVDLRLQIAAERGKSILLSQAFRLQTFPKREEISFRINVEKEIEPRALYSSGNQDIKLQKVVIEETKKNFFLGKYYL